MFITFSSLIEILLLVIALSIDAFAACFAYGTNNVKIPPASAVIITTISSGILVVFLFLGKFIGSFIPISFTTALCFCILFLLGFLKLFDSSIKVILRKLESSSKNYSFSLSGLKFILIVYANPDAANKEDISILSAGEAISLGIALSLDSAAAGLGAGVMSFSPVQVCFFSFLTGLLAITLGSRLGNRIAKKTNRDLSWLSGLMLILLAFLKLS